ncbi:MAG: winged helix-turn-helix transcriptional regulator [Actinobacteria bacterium]|nr:winged helix-turn-helix transcriptional regulator [Actinomycetota bacterium]
MVGESRRRSAVAVDGEARARCAPTRSGVRRFEDLARGLGVARTVLTDRLGRLVDAGVLERRQYEDRPPRSEYRWEAARSPAIEEVVSAWSEAPTAG